MLVVVNQRLEAANTILHEQVVALRQARQAGKLTSEDQVRIAVLKNQSCAHAAEALAQAASGATPHPLDLKHPLPVPSAKDFTNRHGLDAPRTLDRNNLIGLQEHLPNSGQRALVWAELADLTPGHVFNAENINGRIWLFECHDGIAVALRPKMQNKVVGVEPFYDPSGLREKAGFSVVVLP